MSRDFKQIPPIETYPSPQPESEKYIFLARPGLVSDRTWWNSDEIFVDQPTIDEFLLKAPASEIEDPSSSKLCWVEFYQRAVVWVRHPQRFTRDEPGPSNLFSNGKPQQVEKIYGDRFPAASPQLVADAAKDRFTFATVDQILDSGSVTPHMTDWLKKYSCKDNTGGFNRFLIPLLPMLEPELSTALKSNKFSHLDLED